MAWQYEGICLRRPFQGLQIWKHRTNLFLCSRVSKMDLAASQKALREMTVTRAMAKANAEITGDYNPLHFDPCTLTRTSPARPGWNGLSHSRQ